MGKEMPKAMRSRPAAMFAAVALAAWAANAIAQELTASADTPPESAGPGFRTGTDQEQIELLRRLLGVEAPAPPIPAVEPIQQVEPAPVAAERVDPQPEQPSRPQPLRKTTPKPRPAAPARPAASPAAKPLPPEPEPAIAERPPSVAEPFANPAASLLQISETDLPAPGTVIKAAGVERWSHILTPSLRWALHRGAAIEVAPPRPITMEPWRSAATEKYHSQVRLAPDRKSLVNYVAGIPFPLVTADDPDAAVKLMFNFENRISIDDLEARNFGCVTGAIDKDTGIRVEREGRFGALRRLFYTGRLVVDPKPAMEQNAGIRYRESLFPVLEPFNNKGAGFSYARYLDPARPDDAWMYLPATRRVRRLSTAQRSEGIFGVDVDLDSYGGFAGNPAWFDWELLGKKTLLAPMHAREGEVTWCDKPGDFMFCDTWEPREMYVIAARSLIPGYNFSLRILYLDVQSTLIPYTEVYDHGGQLWRAYVQQFKAGVDRPMPYATKSVYPVPLIFIKAVTVFDMQAGHTSRCQFPAPEAAGEEGWYYWFGDKGGTTEDDFDVKTFLTAGR